MTSTAQRLKIRGEDIGVLSASGARYLHRTAFLALPPPDRIAAYLALVWPAMRRACVIERVCRCKIGSMATHTKELLACGTIRRVSRGVYQLVRPGGV
jgi:hypothetical protein